MSKLKILVSRGDYDPRALEPITSDERFDVEIPDKDVSVIIPIFRIKLNFSLTVPDP